MKLFKLFLIWTFLISAAPATIINVPSDQITIQNGIDNATNGDTVLVASGIYFENIDFNGKNIVLGSQLLTTGDTTYISQTVIDGGQLAPVVMFENGEDSTTQLMGFTITNGQGRDQSSTGEWSDDYIIAGGVTCSNNSNPILSYLRIVENTAPYGAGVCIRQSDPMLKNVDICFNKADRNGGGVYCHCNAEPMFENTRIIGNTAIWYSGGITCTKNSTCTLKNVIISKNMAISGGGITCSDDSQLYFENVTISRNTAFDWGGGMILYCSGQIFDENNRCNIYNNYGGLGSDIYIGESTNISIVLDTFSVSTPTEYFVYPPENASYDILYGKITPISHDLYVSPYGNDNNSGLSAANPLHSIAYALSKITADEQNPRTIYIADGTYKPSTGEHFPLNMRDYVSIYGESESSVILDAEGQGGILYFSSDEGVTVENLSITGGNAYRGGGIYCSNSHPTIKNLSIHQNEAMSNGGGIYCEYSNPTIANLTIFENYSDWGGGGIFCNYNSTPEIKNVTISRNSAQYWAGGAYSGGGASPRIINSILWNNFPYETKGTMTIEYSDVEDGNENNGNINANPLFCDPVLATYTLAENSPCLGAGYNGVNMGSQGLGCDSIFIVVNPGVKYVSANGSDMLGDGSYDNPYATIQHALDLSSPGDTVLVYPGTYYENVSLTTKDIVLASFLLTTDDKSYISKTIIDGQAEGSCIYIHNCDSTSVITGFTLIHGKEASGGGVNCFDSSPTLSHLYITENVATQGAGVNISSSNLKLLRSVITQNRAELYGGGLHGSESFPLLSNVVIADNLAEAGGGGCIFYNSRPHFKNVTVKKNIAYYDCGGIGINFSDAIFDSVERCNIYNNYAGCGCDISFFNLDEGNSDITLYADTFTVKNPTDYHVFGIDKFDILTGKISQSNADVYVSPDGSDENSGESPDLPLRTITHALSKIWADSLNPHSVHIAAGRYDRSHGEYFPLNMVDYVSLEGVSADSVILDAEGKTGVISFDTDSGCYLENFCITGGYRYEGGGICCEGSSPNLKNIAITSNTAMQCGGGMACSEYSYPFLENCTISYNQADGGFGGGIVMFQSCASLLNTILWGNIPDEVYFSGAGYDESCVDFSYTDVKDSTDRIITNNNGDVYWYDGNFNSNPLFCNPDSGKFTIAENSPCIGVGKSGENIGALCIGCNALGIDNEQVTLPAKFILYPNYPNPFNQTTTIIYQLPKTAFVELTIHDVTGRLVDRLVCENKNAGSHAVQWHTKNMSSGIYFYTINTNNYIKTRKMLLLK